MNYKRSVFGIVALVFLFGFCIFAWRPILFRAVLAKYKSTDQFVVLPEDSRIRYEEAARDNAIALKEVLGESGKAVESTLHAHFQKPVNAFVCSSQESFNEYVFLSKNVKGAVYWGKLFLSPGAFGQGGNFLKELTAHELTHYLFYTHLGEKKHLENIPLWFREGIAVFVANGGAAYTKNTGVYELISSEEKEAYLSGDVDFWFASKNPMDAVKHGTANWMLYRIGALFVHYLHDSKPDNFANMMQLLLSGTELNKAVQISYGKNIDSLHKNFAQYLTEQRQPGGR